MSLNPFKWFTKGTAEVGTEVATKIADIVERWKPGETTKHEMRMDMERAFAESQASARAHDAPLNSGLAIFDATINGVNRLVRPTVTLFVFGGLLGYWALPDLRNADPIWYEYGQIILVFWFGGRVVSKDIPAAIKFLRQP